MRIATHVSILVSLALLAPACGHSNPAGPPPPPPQAVSLQNITIGGPHRITPGETGRFTATASYSDGSTTDVTNEVQWSSFDANPRTGPTTAHEVLTMSGDNEAKARTIGQAVIYASFGSQRSAAYEVVTYDEDTFAVWGTVTNDGIPLHASVEIVSGTRAGLFVWSDYSAGFVLYGVAGTITLHMSSDGFEEQTREITISSSGPLPTLTLDPMNAPTDVSGMWDVSINAPAGCQNQLGEPLRTRLAVANIVQHSAFFDFSALATPTLTPFSSRGRVDGTTVTVSFAASYEQIFDWTEHIDNGVFVLWGFLAGTAESGVIRGTFNGDFVYYPSQADYAIDHPSVDCRGSDGSFVMTRR